MSQAPRLVRNFRARELAKARPRASDTALSLQNPFLPLYHPVTKKWLPPVYSRRRQADLIKQARLHDQLHLLPPGPKLNMDEWRAKQKQAPESVRWSSPELHAAWRKSSSSKVLSEEELAENVKWVGEVKGGKKPGADIGARLYAGRKKMFKGHRWQRVALERKRKMLARLRDMPRRVWRFRTVCCSLCQPELRFSHRVTALQEEKAYTYQPCSPGEEIRKTAVLMVLTIVQSLYLIAILSPSHMRLLTFSAL